MFLKSNGKVEMDDECNFLNGLTSSDEDEGFVFWSCQTGSLYRINLLAPTEDAS